MSNSADMFKKLAQSCQKTKETEAETKTEEETKLPKSEPSKPTPKETQPFVAIANSFSFVKFATQTLTCEIEHMLTNGGGAIVNTFSIAGLIGLPGHEPYVASKHAVLGLTKTAALEYAKQGIRVNAVCPGAIKTQLIDGFTGGDSSIREYMESLHPIGRLANPEEIVLMRWFGFVLMKLHLS